jgi:hypothetical protein
MVLVYMPYYLDTSYSKILLYLYTHPLMHEKKERILSPYALWQ